LPQAPPPRCSELPPRKVIVGSVVQPFWVQYPGLDQRVAELAAIVGEMEAAAQARYGRGLDLAVLPEVALTGETGEETLARAVAWDGSVSAAFARLARRARCYLVVPTYLRERDAPPRCSNAAVLVDRSGNVAGVYRKVHLVVSDDGKRLEGGATPGREFPVFACDFGKLGIQICYDIEFDLGWRELVRQGAELIAWPTQSPQTAHPAARALAHRVWIVSSTWRDNASLFEPTGKIAAQVRPPARILVEEIDLSYAILPWSAKLRKGKALEEKYGARIGYRYYEDEDCGLFWSNDAETPVRRMIEALGLREADEELARARACYRAARVPGY
jgi:predicted amidohydrolase